MGLKNRLFSIGLICLFITILIFATVSLITPSDTLQHSTPFQTTPNLITGDDSSYALRTPISYDVEGQILNIFGGLSNLAEEAGIMYFQQNFVGVDFGVTYVIFTFSTAGWVLNDLTSLILSWEFQVIGPSHIIGSDQVQLVKVFINYQGASWNQIDEVCSNDSSINRAYGWGDFTIPAPFEDYIFSDQIQLRFEYQTQIASPDDWEHTLYIRMLLLEYQQNAAVTSLPPQEIIVLTPNSTTTGGLNALNVAEGYSYIINTSVVPGSSGSLQFLIRYDLSYYGVESLRGIRFEHLDWFLDNPGVSSIGKIYIVGTLSNSFLCYIRDSVAFADPYVSPNDRRGTFLSLGDPDVNQSVCLLFDIQYNDAFCSSIVIGLDLARLSVVRDAYPLVVSNLILDTIYAEEYVQLNITCLDGRVPITQIAVAPWGDFVGMGEGFYTYSRFISTAGSRNISVVVEDAAGQVYSYPVGVLTVLVRPIAISLFLAEDAYDQVFSIYFTMRDLFSGNPLGLYPFIKTILKNGTLFRQQSHQTTPAGTFFIDEGIVDYLDWNYTVIIETQETPVYEAALVRAFIILSDSTPFISIKNVIFDSPLKASAPIQVDYTIFSQGALDTLWLCRNFTPFIEISPVALGMSSFTFQDVNGTWEYFLYANSTRGQGGTSPPFTLDINALETTLVCNSVLNMEGHAILLEIALFDELNRTCLGIPLNVVIYDFGSFFFSDQFVTGLNGAQLIVHFDQYCDHAFTIQITSESTSLYEGALLIQGEFDYEGYPLYSIIEIGIAAGVVSVVLNLIKRRARLQ